MRKILLTLLLLITFSAGPLFSLEMKFSNDGLGWGFMPEWDDYETYSMTVLQNFDDWETDLNFLCFTDRAEEEADSSRIDCVQIEAVIQQHLLVFDDIILDLKYGGIVRSFNDWQGLFIQTGWHGSVEVLREVPVNYDAPYLQFMIPFTASVSNLLPGLTISAGVQAGWPLEITGEGEIEFSLEEPLQLDLKMGYRESILDSPSEAYSRASEMKHGLYIESDLNFWPFSIRRSHYLQNNWGTGSIGIMVTEPQTPQRADVISQIIISGITHMAYGVKINYTLLPDIIIDNLNLDITYSSNYGWLDAPLDFPKGGRNSEITIGAEPFYKINLGPFRIDPFLKFDCGIRYKQYYELKPTVLTPYFTETSLNIGTGGGIRFLFPFFNERLLGFSIDGGWELPVLSSGALPNTPSGGSFKAKLALAVTG